MSKRFSDSKPRAFFDFLSSLTDSHSSIGKITIYAALGGAAILSAGFMLFFEVRVPHAQADDVATSVNVLNTPPTWTVDAQESTESSTSTPTNAGSVITWTGTGTDSSNDNYFLLICKSSTTQPTAFSNAPPECGGGVSNRWARSATTSSASQATAATTTKETFPFQQENNPWTAWICDANASLARCNVTYTQGSGLTMSPFVVNHPPVFSLVSNNGPVIPGGSITWTASAYDNDVVDGGNTVRLFVCKTSSFNGVSCPGGAWATSTLVSSGPATTTVIQIPTQDALYSAFAFVADNRSLAATSTTQGTNSSFTVSNVAPTISAALISLEAATTSVGNLVLTQPASTSGPFFVKFTVTDNNSCLAASGQREIATTTINVYRSSITQAGCNTSGQYNSNFCYTASSTLFSDFLTCTQDGGSCSGSSDSTATWTCSFPLWFNADPTDVGTQFNADTWKTSVYAYDDNYATSTYTEGTTGNELASFLAFDVTQTSIGYGDLQPGQFNDPLSTSTNLLAQGNVGLDESLYGGTMCNNFGALGGPGNPDACDTDGVSTSNDIPVNNQKFASSSVVFASAFAYNLTASTSPISLGVHVLKTTATNTIQTKNTYWAINIPSAITTAGAYSGQNTITAVKSSSAFW